MSMSLPEKQSLFARLFAEWLTWCYTLPGVTIALSEGYVAITDAADGDYDGPHMKQGGHYNKLAHDVDLFYHSVYITESSHPIWKLLGEKWELSHVDARWGGRFSKPDANHISIEYNGVS